MKGRCQIYLSLKGITKPSVQRLSSARPHVSLASSAARTGPRLSLTIDRMDWEYAIYDRRGEIRALGLYFTTVPSAITSINV